MCVRVCVCVNSLTSVLFLSVLLEDVQLSSKHARVEQLRKHCEKGGFGCWYSTCLQTREREIRAESSAARGTRPLNQAPMAYGPWL